jgi:glycosyltransferase involved in cell wall biosynthesis
MLWLSHPTGNTSVRALLAEMHASGWNYRFHTTLGFGRDSSWPKWSAGSLKSEFSRRTYDLPANHIVARPMRELGRLAARTLGLRNLVNQGGPLSADAVNRDLDQSVATRLHKKTPPPIKAVYAYENGALDTFQTAKRMGIPCCYELPATHWETSQKLLSDEIQRWPEWKDTLASSHESGEMLERKAGELELADRVICPSRFVYRSLPESIRASKPCLIAEFGSPEAPPNGYLRHQESTEKLRVLFVGSMSQRKGLADVFAAMKWLGRTDVELIVLGPLLAPMEFYRGQYRFFQYEPPRPQDEVLSLMHTCDVLLLPAVVAGRPLVQQEALSCGLPLIVTPNAGGEDLIDEGRTGFLVPLRSPKTIAEKIDWFADHRKELPAMREFAQKKAAQYSWSQYARNIMAAVQSSMT